jgi:protein required for attachment to host cells
MENTMEKTWILIADAQHARCFERHAIDHTLTELAGFVYPHATLSDVARGGDLTGAAGKGHGRTGHAGTQLEPHTEAHAKERNDFARHLADYINQGVVEQHCNGLVLIASGPMLGELKHYLSSATAKVLRRCVTSDLTRYQGAELKERVSQALQ